MRSTKGFQDSPEDLKPLERDSQGPIQEGASQHPSPLPESATLPTDTFFLQAMCPRTEKMARPAKRLVQQFPMPITSVSLWAERERLVGLNKGVSSGLGIPGFVFPTPPKVSHSKNRL